MNLILITIDCLRADHLSCLGYSKKTSPNLDYLASTGVLFSQAISVASSTPPSFISLFTSTYPLMYGGQVYVTDLRTTLAQVLRDHGYHTAGFHSNPWLASLYGYHRGFDNFDDDTQKLSYQSLLSRPREAVKRLIGTTGRLYDFLSKMYVALVPPSPCCKAEVLNKRAISWLCDNASDFFLWLHYMDVHEPYLPSSRFTSALKRAHILELQRRADHSPASLSSEEVNELIDLYDTQIGYVDEMIGSLLHTLKQKNVLDNTFVIVTADHGQQFREHGGYLHGLHLYDEVIHVPLIVAGPGLGRQVIGQQVSLLGLAPTILEILEIDKPKAFLGESLAPLLMGTTKVGALTAISEEGRTKRGYDMRRPRLCASRRKISFRTGKWKYIYTEGKQGELYALEDDPKETQNLIDVSPEIAAELRASVMDHIQFEDKSTPGEEERVKEKIRRLKGSGKI